MRRRCTTSSLLKKSFPVARSAGFQPANTVLAPPLVGGVIGTFSSPTRGDATLLNRPLGRFFEPWLECGKSYVVKDAPVAATGILTLGVIPGTMITLDLGALATGDDPVSSATVRLLPENRQKPVR